MTDTLHPLVDQMTALEATRPEGPALTDLTEAERAPGRHLAAVHRMHLAEVQRLAQIIEAVGEGAHSPEAFRDEVARLPILHNLRAVGTLCGRECQALSFHHDAEEQSIFPILAAEGGAALKAVIDQLQREHAIVHALIDELEERAVALVETPEPEALTAAKGTVAAIERVVKSHFGYEDREIGDALGRYDAM